MVEINPLKIQCFETRTDFQKWLAEHHQTASELWLKIYKKSAQKLSIDWEEAVIEALCWGWIDSIKKTYDKEAYVQRFTPRKKGSLWSKRNTEHVERLIREKRMQAPGLKTVQEAKADGRWEQAYASMSEMVMPEDFLKVLQSKPRAQERFEALSRQDTYSIYYGLQTARTPHLRQKRFDRFLQGLQE